jgi:hypothetical protein
MNALCIYIINLCNYLLWCNLVASDVMCLVTLLRMNWGLTSAMSFHLKQWREPSRPQIVFKNIEIGYQSELSFLGIHITETLKWNAHVRVLKAKLCKVIYMVKILKKTLSPYMLKFFYFSNFESRMRYGIILCGGDRVSHSIFNLQKRVLWVIHGVSSRTSCRQIFKDNILTLPSLYIQGIHKRMVRFQKLITNLFLTLHRHRGTR